MRCYKEDIDIGFQCPAFIRPEFIYEEMRAVGHHRCFIYNAKTEYV